MPPQRDDATETVLLQINLPKQQVGWVGKPNIITSFSVMDEPAGVEHAASLFLGLDQRFEQASCMFYDAN
jgi:hypothetical protein